MADITLSKAVRSNLLNLQSTADLMSKTQERLATGKKVNSALDNPTNFFTASSLTARAGDMGALLDSMKNGIQTLEAADNGLTAITKTLESMQSTLTQARQDKSFKTESYTLPETGLGTGDTVGFSGGAFETAPADVNLTKGTSGSVDISFGSATNLDDGTDTASITFDIAVDGGATQSISIDGTVAANYGNGDSTIDDADELAAILTGEVTGATATNNAGTITLASDTTGTSSSVAISGYTYDGDVDGDSTSVTDGTGLADDSGTGAADGGDAKTVDELVAEINDNTGPYSGFVRASNDNGKLRVENLSTQALSVTTPAEVVGATEIEGNTVREGLAKQYNELRDQLDKLADDASFNGVNLLRGDNLQITFNETGTSEINIQTEDAEAINSGNLGIQTSLTASQLDSDADIDGFLTEIKTALGEVRSQSSSFGSNLSIVENRQEFTKNMINTLETGASNLTLADTNEEAANLLALQTRQQLSSTALSMASQADQNVLRLF